MIVEIPLSAAQAGIWYAIKAGASSAEYNIAGYTQIDGGIDPALFEQALQHVVLETEALRIRLIQSPDGPRQSINPTLKHTLTYRDVSSESDPIAVAEAMMRADTAQPLDLITDPLFAFGLFRSGPDQFLWYQRYHHLIMDAYGLSLISLRLGEIYSALAAGNVVEHVPLGSYAKVVGEDVAYRASTQCLADRQFWRDLMVDCPEPPSLSVQAMSPATPWLRQTAELSSDAAGELPGICASTGTIRTASGHHGSGDLHPPPDRCRRRRPGSVDDGADVASRPANSRNGDERCAAAPAGSSRNAGAGTGCSDATRGKSRASPPALPYRGSSPRPASHRSTDRTTVYRCAAVWI